MVSVVHDAGQRWLAPLARAFVFVHVCAWHRMCVFSLFFLWFLLFCIWFLFDVYMTFYMIVYIIIIDSNFNTGSPESRGRGPRAVKLLWGFLGTGLGSVFR